jgi:hypothetical protein
MGSVGGVSGVPMAELTPAQKARHAAATFERAQHGNATDAEVERAVRWLREAAEDAELDWARQRGG